MGKERNVETGLVLVKRNAGGGTRNRVSKKRSVLIFHLDRIQCISLSGAAQGYVGNG